MSNNYIKCNKPEMFLFNYQNPLSLLSRFLATQVAVKTCKLVLTKIGGFAF